MSPVKVLKVLTAERRENGTDPMPPDRGAAALAREASTSFVEGIELDDDCEAASTGACEEDAARRPSGPTAADAEVDVGAAGGARAEVAVWESWGPEAKGAEVNFGAPAGVCEEEEVGGIGIGAKGA